MKFSENKPIYLQITDQIMDMILSGIYLPEGRLPSVRDYASKVEVNANTVMRAYEWLQQQSVIFNRRGIGYFVLPEAQKRILEMRRNVFFRDEVSYFFGRLYSFGLSPDDVKSIYSEYISRQNKDL